MEWRYRNERLLTVTLRERSIRLPLEPARDLRAGSFFECAGQAWNDFATLAEGGLLTRAFREQKKEESKMDRTYFRSRRITQISAHDECFITASAKRTSVVNRCINHSFVAKSWKQRTNEYDIRHHF